MNDVERKNALFASGMLSAGFELELGNTAKPRCTKIWGPERKWWLSGDQAALAWNAWESINRKTTIGPSAFLWAAALQWSDFLAGLEAAGALGVDKLARWLRGKP